MLFGFSFLISSTGMAAWIDTITSAYKDESGHVLYYTQYHGAFAGNYVSAEKCYECKIQQAKISVGKWKEVPVLMVKNPERVNAISDDWLKKIVPQFNDGATPTYTFSCPEKGVITYSKVSEEELATLNASVKEKTFTFKDTPIPNVRRPVFILKLSNKEEYIVFDSFINNDDKTQRLFYGAPGAMKELKITHSSVMLDGGTRSILAHDENEKEYDVVVPFQFNKRPSLNTYQPLTLLGKNEMTEEFLQKLGINPSDYSIESLELKTPCSLLSQEVSLMKKAATSSKRVPASMKKSKKH